MINPLEELCFRLSRRALRDKRVDHTAAPTTADYVQQRRSGLERQFTRHFDRSRIVDKRVLDFGSGAGELSRLAWELGAQSVIGVDLSEKFVEFARESTAPHGLGDKVSFVVGEMEASPRRDGRRDPVLRRSACLPTERSSASGVGCSPPVAGCSSAGPASGCIPTATTAIRS